METLTEEYPAVKDALRRWARGAYAEEAAVELVCRAFGGRFASPRWAWVQPCDQPGWFWLDGEELLHGTGYLSGGERRVLAIAGALVTGGRLDELGGCLAGMDRTNLTLVLAALAHAGGSHEHARWTVEDGRRVPHRYGPLIAWPAA